MTGQVTVRDSVLPRYIHREQPRRTDAGFVRAQYVAQDELVVLDHFLGPDVLSTLVSQLNDVQEHIRRKRVPGYKSSESVSYHTLLEHAPAFTDLYRSTAMISFLEQVTGASLQVCPESDAHACAIYQYSRAGDRVGFHYDTSHYRGARYTVLIGLVNDCSNHLHCRLYTRMPDRPNEDRMVATDPGKLILFNGDRLYHAVTPLGVNERRVVLTMQYVTDPYMAPARRVISNLKDAMTYFGFREWWKMAARR